MKKITTFLLLCLAVSMSAQTNKTLSLVYTQVGSEDQSYNTCNYFDKDKIILDSDFGFSKGKDDVCNRNNGGEIDGMIMMKNDVTACSRQSYPFAAGNITITMPVQCKDHGTYTGPTITIDGKTASFGQVTFDNDFDKKDISTSLTVTEGTHDISLTFKGSDKFYFSTLTISVGGEGGGEGGGDTPPTPPTPVGDCPEGTALTLSASNTNWSTTFDVAKQQINFQGDWAACGWNMSEDWTKYKTLVFTFEETLGAEEAITFYVNGDSDPAEVGKIEAGENTMTVDLSAITTVSSIMFKSAKARILTIACAVLQGEGGDTPPTPPTPVGDCPEGTALTLSASNTNWSTTFDVAKQQINFQGDWAACGWNMSEDWTKYKTLVFTFEETLGAEEAITFYVNGDSDPAEVGKIEAGENTMTVDLSAITTVSSIMFKSAKARTLTIACAVLQEDGGDTPTPTAIEQVRPVEIKYMEIYTTMGGRVAAVEGATMPELAPGIYVVRVNGDKQTMKIVR